MQIAIHSPDFKLTEGLKNHIHRKLQFALSRIESRIKSVSIILNDVNGPKGGVDKHCRFTVCLDSKENIVINDTQTDLYYAIDRAMQRVNHTITRKIDRASKKRKQPQRSILHLNSVNNAKANNQAYVDA